MKERLKNFVYESALRITGRGEEAGFHKAVREEAARTGRPEAEVQKTLLVRRFQEVRDEFDSDHAIDRKKNPWLKRLNGALRATIDKDILKDCRRSAMPGGPGRPLGVTPPTREEVAAASAYLEEHFEGKPSVLVARNASTQMQRIASFAERIGSDPRLLSDPHDVAWLLKKYPELAADIGSLSFAQETLGLHERKNVKECRFQAAMESLRKSLKEGVAKMAFGAPLAFAKEFFGKGLGSFAKTPFNLLTLNFGSAVVNFGKGFLYTLGSIVKLLAVEGYHGTKLGLKALVAANAKVETWRK